MSIQIGKAVYSILTGNTAVYTYVSGKTYPIFAPDEVLNPFIVYSRNSVKPSYTKDGLSFDECLVSIKIISDNYTENINISSAVRTALEFISGTFGGIYIYQSLLTSASEDYGVDGYITTLEFTIKCK